MQSKQALSSQVNQLVELYSELNSLGSCTVSVQQRISELHPADWLLHKGHIRLMSCKRSVKRPSDCMQYSGTYCKQPTRLAVMMCYTLWG